MYKSLKKIYDLLYSPIVTPYNLLANANLDNYKYVNFYKGEKGLIAEMQCVMEDGVSEVFYYHFDENNFLQEVYRLEGKNKVLIYSRAKQIVKEKKKFIEEYKKSITHQTS
ncbi:MAG: hypothetical protein PWP75_1045 [Caldanaerobacter sp.]|nr:hypothetical protein [Caldanaerobacter sp.]MDK2836224.1 hypothetical protein [Thermosediminibacterales bacterium]